MRNIFNYKDLLLTITDQFPEFKKSDDFNLWKFEDDVENKFILEEFGKFSVKEIEGKNIDFKTRFFYFINIFFELNHNNHDLINRIGVDIFENLALSDIVAKISLNELKNKALKSFVDSLKYRNPKILT